MQITFFFRKKSLVYHSIENLFESIIQALPKENTYKIYNAKIKSKGLIKRFRIGFDARRNQGKINHITGDIHFIALFLKKRNTVLTIHDIGVIKNLSFFKKFILKLFWFDLPVRNVKIVTVISEFTKNELVKLTGIKEQKVKIIRNCISDTYQYFPKEKSNLKPVLLQIGTKANKNLERLINAIENMGCKLVIVGQLNQNQLKKLKDYNIDFDNLCNISEAGMFELYKKCDILTFVSTYEGFGMPVIEANAVGVPVLASKIEPIKTIVGNAALLVDPFNEEDIKNGIQKLILDEQVCHQLIENGIQNSKKYRAKEIAKQYMELYKDNFE